MAGGVSVRDVDVSAPSPVFTRQSEQWTEAQLDRGTERKQAGPENGIEVEVNRKLTSVFVIQAQKFINAYSAFLKRQGKLPIPGSCEPYDLLHHDLHRLNARWTAVLTAVVSYVRLGRHSQNLQLKRTPTPIHRLVRSPPGLLLPSHPRATSHLPSSSHPVQIRSLFIHQTGSTPAPPPWPDTSTSAKRSVSAAYEKRTAARRTAARGRRITSMLAGASIAR